MDDSSLALLLRACPRLRSFDLRCRPGGALPLSLAELAGGCPLLERLNLDVPASSEGVEAVAEGCRRLRCLELRSLELGDDALKAMGACLAELEIAELQDCEGISDRGVEALVKGCARLEVLRLGCEDPERGRVGDAAVAAIARHCEQLRELDLTYRHAVTDEALKLLATGCPRLATLLLDGCREVTGPGLKQLAGLRALHTVSLLDMPHVTSADIEQLQAV